MAAYAGVAAERWRARPALARAIRVVAFAGPVAAVTVLAFFATRWLPSVSGLVPSLLRWSFIAVVALLCAVLAERLLSRLLPIAALLDLDIGFPAGAPTRLRIASLASLGRRDATLADRLPDTAGNALDIAAEYALVGYATKVRPGLQPRPHLERVRMLSMLVAARLGLPEDDSDRLQWALLLRELGAVRADERDPDHPLVTWLGPWSALLHGPFIDIARDAPDADIAAAAHAAAVSDAYAVVTASHPYRRGVGTGHAGRRLKTLGDPRLLPEAVDALLTLPQARLRKAIGFTGSVSPTLERLAPAPQPLMAATAIVVVLALAATPAMRFGGDDAAAELAGLDTAPVQPSASPAAPTPLPTATATERTPDEGDEGDDGDERADDRTKDAPRRSGAVVARSGADVTSDARSGWSSGSSSGGGATAEPSKPTTKPTSKPSATPSPEPTTGTGGGSDDGGTGGGSDDGGTGGGSDDGGTGGGSDDGGTGGGSDDGGTGGGSDDGGTGGGSDDGGTGGGSDDGGTGGGSDDGGTGSGSTETP